MKIVVLDAATLGRDLDLSPLDRFGSVTVRQGTRPEELADVLADADAAVLNKVRLTREALLAAPRLRVILEAATGYDNIDLATCRERGIAVCNVPGYSAPTVAQVTLAMALDLGTHLWEYRSFVSSGAYSASGAANRLEPVYHDLCGQTWGIVGGGNIGRRVAAAAQALGMRALICRRHPEPGDGTVDFGTVIRESDVISLHVPLTAETRGMISREVLASMKPGAMLINVARGAVTDEAAVAEAILSGRLGAFGCDVYSTEPFPAEHPFTAIRDLPNVILTPHMAWGSFEARSRCLGVICENLAAFLDGGRLNRVE